jgi:hypothetical protein
MERGGYGRLLYDLLRWDHKQVNLREVPKTEGLMAQKIHSASPEESWLMDLLNRGVLPGGCKMPNACAKHLLLEQFVQRSGWQQGRSSETKLGLFLKKRLPRLESARVLIRYYKTFRNMRDDFPSEERARVWVFPSLAECREAFAASTQQTVVWDEQAEWEHEIPWPKDTPASNVKAENPPSHSQLGLDYD